jgi:Integrase core domain
MSKLAEVYYNPSNPGSFGGVPRLHHQLQSVPRESVKWFLQSSDVYTTHKQRYSKFRRKKVVVPAPNYLWQADLIFMQKYRKQNKPYLYILTVIDAFSRVAFAVPLKNKSGSEVIRGFQKIFSSHKYRPKKLQCDQGTEFFNNKFKLYLKSLDIELFHNYSDFKACIIERFNRSLLTRLAKYFTYTNSYKYVNVLPQILKSYNGSVHRSLGIPPRAVNKYNQMDVWLHINKDLYTKPCKKPEIKLYDKVRLCKRRKTWDKGYDRTYTSEIFEVVEVLENSVPVVYKVRDLKGEDLHGFFYEQELVRVV